MTHYLYDLEPKLKIKMHFPRDAFSHGGIFPVIHFPRDAFSLGCIFPVRHFPSDAFSLRCIFPGMHFPSDAFSQGGIPMRISEVELQPENTKQTQSKHIGNTRTQIIKSCSKAGGITMSCTATEATSHSGVDKSAALAGLSDQPSA